MSLVGFDVGGVDGRYGPKTAAAVKDLQQRSQVTVDGVVGPQTWGIIDALEDEDRLVEPDCLTFSGMAESRGW